MPRGLGIGIGLLRSQLLGSDPAILKFDFNSVAKGKLTTASFANIFPNLIYTCASGSRYVETSEGVLFSGIGVDEVPFGRYGLDLPPATTNRIVNGGNDLANATTWPGAGAGVTTLSTSAVSLPDGSALAQKADTDSGALSRYYTATGLPSAYRVFSGYIREGTPGIERLTWSTHSVAASANWDFGLSTQSWKRYSTYCLTTSGTPTNVPIDGRNITAGAPAAGARSMIHGLWQLEDFLHATTFHIGTRSAPSLQISAAAMLSAIVGDRIRVAIKFTPGWVAANAAAPGAHANLVTNIFSVNSSNRLTINSNFGAGADLRKLTLNVAGVSAVSSVAVPSWNIGDTVEIRIAGGGGSVATRANVRINNGPVVSVGFSDVQGIWGAGALSLLGGMQAGIESIKFYATDADLFSGVWDNLTTLSASFDTVPKGKLTATDFATQYPDFTYTCASGLRYVETAEGVLLNGVGVDEVPFGRYGLNLPPARNQRVPGGGENDLSNATAWTLAAGGGTQTYTNPGDTLPDGSAAAQRTTQTSGFTNRSINQSALPSVPRTFSFYVKETNANPGGAYQMTYYANVGQPQSLGGVATSSWKRIVGVGTTAGTSARFLPQNATDGVPTGGIPAQDLDALQAFYSIEDGSFPSPFMLGNRAAAFLKLKSATLISTVAPSGRVWVSIVARPDFIVSSAAVPYGANGNQRILEWDATNRVYVYGTFGGGANIGKLQIEIGGGAVTTTNAMTWANPNQTVEYRLAFGGGLPTEAKGRVDSGAVVVLQTGGTSLIAVPTTDMSIGCNATTSFGWNYGSIKFYATDSDLFSGEWA